MKLLRILSGMTIAGLMMSFMPVPAAPPQLDCNKCKAIIFEGQILQTCPAATSGGDYCIIDGDECHTVGICIS